MSAITESSRETPVVDEADVLVVGGGPAGFIAATCAARMGARVALVERYGRLGGLATGGLVLHMMAIYDRATGERWIGGAPWESMERLDAMGGLVYESPTSPHADSELLTIVAERMCMEAGVALRLHSWAVGAVVEDGRVRGVIVESKAGRQAILARVCIDATGDGDVAALAGAGYEMGSMRIGLPIKVGGIDIEAFHAFDRDDPEGAKALIDKVTAMGGYRLRPRPTPYSGSGVHWINIRGIDRRDGENSSQDAGPSLDPLDPVDLSYAEVELRRRVMDSLEFYRNRAPGFAHVHLLAFASQLGVRDSRHIHGRHTLTKADALAERRFDDAIGCAALWFTDVGRHEFPFGCLVPEEIGGLLVAGRCISVDRAMSNSARLIPPAMVTGQAAGVAAAMAARDNVEPGNVDTSALRRQLTNDGVIL